MMRKFLLKNKKTNKTPLTKGDDEKKFFAKEWKLIPAPTEAHIELLLDSLLHSRMKRNPPSSASMPTFSAKNKREKTL